MAMRDLPLRYRLIIYLIAAAVVIYQAAPVVAAVLSAPAEVDALDLRMTTIEQKMVRDSARQERMLCMQEVQVGIRPELDLTTRCAR